MTEFASTDSLSKFAQAITASPPLPYIKKVIQYLPSQYDEKERPDGKILLCTAENKLLSPTILQKIQDIFSQQPIPPAVLNYTSSTGLPSLRQKLSQFLSDNLFQRSVTIDPNHLVVGAGCVAMLTSLSLLLLEEGDAVLIPSPYYPAFDHDFFNFAHAVVCPIHGTQTGNPSQPFGVVTEEALETAYLAAQRRGRRPRAILLSNPNNPLASLHTLTEVRATLRFLDSHPELHLIMDEIYALSVFPAYSLDTPLTLLEGEGESAMPTRFVSVVELMGGRLGDRVHVVWSFSKDFAVSGLRVGVLYSQNQALLAAMPACNEPMMASNLTQYCLEQMLADETFVQSYLAANRQALHTSYEFLVSELCTVHVPVLPAHGAIFAFADFRHYLSQSGTLSTSEGFAEELALFEFLADEGVILTPGESCQCPLPGFFRICYAFVPLSALTIATQRLRSALRKWQEVKQQR